MSSTYNGWTNYATWRVNLEMVEADGYFAVLEDWSPTSEPDDLIYDVAQVIRENCTDVISEHGKDLTLDYALAFLDNVNWREIAKHIVQDWLDEK
jgi:hypothetical protein